MLFLSVFGTPRLLHLPHSPLLSRPPRLLGKAKALHALVPLVVCLASAGQPVDVRAQATDAGRILDSLPKRELPVPLPTLPNVNVKPQPNVTNTLPDVGAQLEVKKIIIQGATLLSPQRLDMALKPYTGKPLTVSQLQEAAGVITQVYRDAGYPLAYAVVLPQPIADGVVTLTVREGRIERVDTSPAQSHDMPRVAQGEVGRAATVGSPVSTSQLEESLLLVNDLPGRGRASAEISPGTQPDTSVVALDYTRGPRFGGYVLADNAGNRFTGRNRLLGAVNVNEPFGAGDQLSFTVLTTGSNLNYGQAGLRVPLSARTSLGGSVSKLSYKLCCQPAGSDTDGSVDSASLDVAHTLSLTRAYSFALFGGLDTKRLRSNRNAVEQSNRRVQGYTAGLRGYALVAGQNSWSLALRGGRVSLSGNAADAALDDTTTRVGGQYYKLTGQLNRLQPFSSAWSGALNLRGQANTGRNLESSERFVLGGTDGVRAYPSGEAVGDTGWLANLELRYAVAAAPGLAFATFVDVGGVKRYSKNADLLRGTASNYYHLSGWGVGVRYDLAQASVNLYVAQPIGRNRGVDVDGNNNEGRKDGTQAGLSANWRF